MKLCGSLPPSSVRAASSPPRFPESLAHGSPASSFQSLPHVQLALLPTGWASEYCGGRAVV